MVLEFLTYFCRNAVGGVRNRKKAAALELSTAAFYRMLAKYY
jgi:hypothetical protein